MNAQEYNLNIRPGYGYSQTVKVSQDDIGRPLEFHLYDGMDLLSITVGSVITIHATKPSGLGFTETCTWSGSTASISTTESMTQESGAFPAELVITSGGDVLGTANFTFCVERSPHQTGTTDGVAEDLQDIYEQLDDLKEDIENISGISDDVKTALLQIAQKVAYIDDDGADYYQDLYDALYPAIPATAITLSDASLSFLTLNQTATLTATVTPSNTTDTVVWESSNNSVATVSSSGVVTSTGLGSAIITATAGSVSATCSVVVASATVTSIEATYTQGGTVYNYNSLNSLKADLVVVATWSDSTTSTVSASDYTLSGTLAEGTSTITVSYGGKTDTFTVIVTGSAYTHYWDFTDSLTDTLSGVTATLGNCTLTSDGIKFTTASPSSTHDPVGNQYIELGNVFGIGKTLEIGLKDIEAKFGTVNGNICEFWDGSDTDPGSYNAFGWRYGSGASTRKWGNITKDTGSWKYWSTSDVSTKTALDAASHVIEYIIQNDGLVYQKVDGVAKNGTVSDYYCAKYTDGTQAQYAVIGSKWYYPNFYDMTVTYAAIK